MIHEAEHFIWRGHPPAFKSFLRRVGVRQDYIPTRGEASPIYPRCARARAGLLHESLSSITPTMGVVVVNVDAQGPADDVGIEPGDVIREVDRQPVANITDFQAIVRELRAATGCCVLVQRADVALYAVFRTRNWEITPVGRASTTRASAGPPEGGRPLGMSRPPSRHQRYVSGSLPRTGASV